jgi:Tectonin domain
MSQIQVTASAFTQIAVGPNGVLWALDSSQRIWQYAVGAWSQIPGALAQIAVGPDNSVWGLNSAGQIFTWSEGGWQNIPGALTKLWVASASQVWGMNSWGQFYALVPATNSWAYLGQADSNLQVALAPAVVNGQSGVGVASVSEDSQGNLVVTFTDGSEHVVGPLPVGPEGPPAPATTFISIEEYDGAEAPPSPNCLGVVDGANTVFTLSHPPIFIPLIFEELPNTSGFVNLEIGNQLALNGQQINFANAPALGTRLKVWYAYTS